MQRIFLQDAEMEKHERLRQARIEAGFSSAADAARRVGMAYGTYAGHENGLRGMKDTDLKLYAKAFRKSVAWLAFGEDESETISEIIIRGTTLYEGKVCTDPQKSPLSSDRAYNKFGSIIPGFTVPANMIAFWVHRKSMVPFYNAGDCIVCYENTDRKPEEMSGIRSIFKTSEEDAWIGEYEYRKDPGNYIIKPLNGYEFNAKTILWVGEIAMIVPVARVLRGWDVSERENEALAARREEIEKAEKGG